MLKQPQYGTVRILHKKEKGGNKNERLKFFFKVYLSWTSVTSSITPFSLFFFSTNLYKIPILQEEG